MITIFAFFAIMSYVADAKDSPVNRLQSTDAKRLTREALTLIKKDDWDSARQKTAESRDPLASKIYHWLWLRDQHPQEWTEQDFIRLSHFIRENPNWPSIKKMQVKAEGAMPQNLSNAEVLAWYDDFRPKTPFGMRRYIDTLMIEGRAEKGRSVLADWWAQGFASAAQQNEILREYGRYLTRDVHKKRLDHLLKKKQFTDARALAKIIGEDYKALTEARIALAQNKVGGLQNLVDSVPQDLQNDSGLLYERLHWRRKKKMNEGAIEILQNLAQHYKKDDYIYNRKGWWKERHIMIRRLIENGDYDTAYALASEHIQKDDFPFLQAQWVSGWLALRFVSKPTEAYERFSAFYAHAKTPISRSRAAYWAARSASDLGQKDIVQNWYKKASVYPTTYYGQLAGRALSRKSKGLKNKLPSLSKRDRARFTRSEMMQAAMLFKSVGDTHLSTQFLNMFLERENDPKAYRYLAESLAERGDVYGAIKVAKRALKKDLFLNKQSYPTVTRQLDGIHGTEWALIHALIRQESMFDPMAKSPAGALGLMQIMPSTAEYVSGKMNIAYQKKWLRERPKYNIVLGAYYISELIKRYDGSYPLAIAAYNAGPGRVNSWLKTYGDPRMGEISYIDWIELIPIYETRNYVQRVMEGAYVYRMRLNNIQEKPDHGLYIDF